MLKKYILVLFSLCVSSVAVSQQNPLLEKYRSMAVEYSHDLKAADKKYCRQPRTGESSPKGFISQAVRRS